MAAVLALLATPAAIAQARKPSQVQEKRGELNELKGRIDDLRKEVADAEESRADVADELEEAETAISAANRRLRQLTEQRARAQRELRDLEAQVEQLERRVESQQDRLARLLRNRFVAGEAESLQHLLRGNDPNQIARDSHYLAGLSRAQADLIGELRHSLDDKRELAQKVRGKTEELAAIEKNHEKERAELVVQQQKRRASLDTLAGQIKARQREIDSLKRDERRLTRLIDGLSRIVKTTPRKPPPPIVPKAVEIGPAPAAAVPPAGVEPRSATPAAEAAEAPRIAATRRDLTEPAPAAPPQLVARNENMPDESFSGQPLTKLKGQLRLPARGELINRFGTPRQEGGTTWKGVFIRAPQGGEVKAIATGRVVFADWLRGFGNLIILDHGDSYLSVYGNNESVFKTVGQPVQAGETIASVGNSGGNMESGLYFELRHQGQPLDPLRWVRLR